VRLFVFVAALVVADVAPSSETCIGFGYGRWGL